METPSQLRLELRNRISSLKSLEYLMSTALFDAIWEKVTAGEREEFTEYLKGAHSHLAKEWFKKHQSRHKDLGEKSVVELRKIGQQLGIANYYKLPKVELLSEIQRCLAKK